jgi:hypothetical protein
MIGLRGKTAPGLYALALPLFLAFGSVATAQPTADLVLPSTTGPTNANSVSFLVRFSDTMQNFNNASDLLITHTGTANTGATIVNTGNDRDFNVDVTGLTGDGTFSLAVSTASDVADTTGTLLLSSVTSALVTLDNTAPAVATVTDEGDYQLSTTFRFSWNDALTTDTSGIFETRLLVGTLPGFADQGIFTVTGLNTFNFSGAANTVYYGTLAATDNAGNVAFGTPSDGIASDTIGPNLATPTDLGLYSNTTGVTFNWLTPTDDLSGVNVVFLQAGTIPGGNSLFNGEVTSLTSQVVTAAEGQTVYARLVGVDALGNISFSGNSNGITVDTTGPFASPPTDEEDFTTANTATFNWFNPVDLLSGVAEVRLQVGTAPGLSDVYNAVVTGTTETVPILEGQTLYARLVSRDGAGNTSFSGNSNGITRDTTPPTIVGPFDSGDFTTNSNVTFTWGAISDTASGLALARLQVGSTPGANNLLDEVITPSGFRNLTIASGTTAYARIVAFDNAGNVAISANTNGIAVDTTTPTADFINLSDPNFLFHTEFFFQLVSSEPLDLSPLDFNLVGTTPGSLQIIATANPLETTVRVIMDQPVTDGSIAVVLNAGATDMAGNPVIPTPVSDIIQIRRASVASEETWMLHPY